MIECVVSTNGALATTVVSGDCLDPKTIAYSVGRPFTPYPIVRYNLLALQLWHA